MKGFKWVKVLSVAILLVCSSWVGASSAPETQVEITDPERDGMKVGFDMMVKGTASIPSGTHLWVMAHRIRGFEHRWWPQREAKIDPVTGKWTAYCKFGEEGDIGEDFEIAAIVVNEREHLKLADYENWAPHSKWPPIKMPPTLAAPVIRTVKKAGH